MGIASTIGILVGLSLSQLTETNPASSGTSDISNDELVTFVPERKPYGTDNDPYEINDSLEDAVGLCPDLWCPCKEKLKTEFDGHAGLEGPSLADNDYYYFSLAAMPLLTYRSVPKIQRAK